MFAELRIVEKELTVGEFIDRAIEYTETEIQRQRRFSEEALRKKISELEVRLAGQRGVKRRMSEEVRDMLFSDLDKLFTWHRGD